MSLTKGLVSTSFSFQAALPGETRTLEWKRTRSMGVHSSPYGNTKLVDERSHDVLAVFSSNPTSLVTGRLDIYVDYGESFDRMALLCEKSNGDRLRGRFAQDVKMFCRDR